MVTGTHDLALAKLLYAIEFCREYGDEMDYAEIGEATLQWGRIVHVLPGMHYYDEYSWMWYSVAEPKKPKRGVTRAVVFS